MPTERPQTFRAYVSGGIPPEIEEIKLGTAGQIHAMLDGNRGASKPPGARIPIDFQASMEVRNWQRKLLRDFVNSAMYRVKKGDIIRLHANCLVYCEGTR